MINRYLPYALLCVVNIPILLDLLSLVNGYIYVVVCIANYRNTFDLYFLIIGYMDSRPDMDSHKEIKKIAL